MRFVRSVGISGVPPARFVSHALLVAGIGLLAIGLVGVAVIPASGFWAGIGIGCWLLYRGRPGRQV